MRFLLVNAVCQSRSLFSFPSENNGEIEVYRNTTHQNALDKKGHKIPGRVFFLEKTRNERGEQLQEKAEMA